SHPPGLPFPVTCLNGGVANRTECLCPPGFSGLTCERPDAAARCAAGSTAVGDRCVCPPGLSGRRCTVRDEATACQHGGTAVGTECYCPPGFEGPRCERQGATTTTMTSTTTTSTATPARPTTKSTPRSTRRTTTTTVPTTTDPCLNGGYWTGTICLCPPNVDGAHCQFGASTINITAELGSSVALMARVTNRRFSGDMGDPSSAAFRSFADEFSRTMDRVYQNISGYRGTRVLALTEGSVVVNYKVLLQPPAGGQANASLGRRTRELLEASNSAIQPQNCSEGAEGLCFGALASRRAFAAAPELNATELCRKYTPANFSHYYYPYWTKNGLLCVTNCTLNVPGTINCGPGLCRVTLDGPRCFCPDVPWYLSSGDRCQTHVSKLGLGLGVGLGLGLTLLILLVLCIVLSVCLAHGKRKTPSTSEDNSWPDGKRKARATGIYHVNGRGSMPRQGPYAHGSYKNNAEVADPPVPGEAEGVESL
ncbi:mucin-3B-like, partial [Oxyura jamaicensis]|uniref:mucin-3B-like n=1 Tax=Oxyura jamaicensis TaxID=8884 RepID=UPI0015A5059C